MKKHDKEKEAACLPQGFAYVENAFGFHAFAQETAASETGNQARGAAAFAG